MQSMVLMMKKAVRVIVMGLLLAAALAAGESMRHLDGFDGDSNKGDTVGIVTSDLAAQELHAVDKYIQEREKKEKAAMVAAEREGDRVAEDTINLLFSSSSDSEKSTLDDNHAAPALAEISQGDPNTTKPEPEPEHLTLATVLDEAVDKEFLDATKEEGQEGLKSNYNVTLEKPEAKEETVIRLSKTSPSAPTQSGGATSSESQSASNSSLPSAPEQQSDEVEELIDQQNNEYVLANPNTGKSESMSLYNHIQI